MAQKQFNSPTNPQHRNRQQSPQQKKKGFNFYWFYGLLALAILFIGLYGMEPGPQSVDNVRLEEMIRNHDIEKIVIVKQKEQARIYLDPASADRDTAYVNAFKANKNGPHFYTDITDASSFKEEVVKMELAAYQRDTVGMSDADKAEYDQSHKNIVINV